jgi:hypothetical protein
VQRRADLPQVAHGGRFARIPARLGKDWEQDPGQDRDDGDHDEQLDEGEPGSAAAPHPVKSSGW